jgi:hypothetical protein
MQYMDTTIQLERYAEMAGAHAHTFTAQHGGGARNGPKLFYLDNFRYNIQLNQVNEEGWLYAPFGINERMGDSEAASVSFPVSGVSYRNQDNHQKLIRNVQIMEASILSAFKAKMGKEAKEAHSIVKTLSDGTQILTLKANRYGKESAKVKVWQADNGMYQRREAQDVKPGSMCVVTAKLWGVWCYNKRYGLGLKAVEVVMKPEEVIMAPTFGMVLPDPGLTCTGGVTVKSEPIDDDAATVIMEVTE